MVDKLQSSRAFLTMNSKLFKLTSLITAKSIVQTQMAFRRSIVLLTLMLLSVFAASLQPLFAQDSTEFNRDIRPILSDRCFQCHGPDEKKREADLRLDLESEAKKDLGGYFAIVPGSLGESEIIDRITSDDPDVVMPPPDSGKSLTEHDKELLKRWIKEDAPFEKHWSFQGIARPNPPAVEKADWARSEIDRFVLAKLESKNLKPAPPADANTLIRRLSLDLTGLPPTPAQVKEFLNDESSGAYEKLVDRLLNSKHYGERIGRHWLDLARYADSNGYANDGLRSIWPYRDWVIRSLNQDMPFDQFTTEQLAGDLLADPTESQMVATGFHRNTPLQTEGGSDPEQYRVERTKNRTDTTGAVWLGLTVGCAQCHTHKFDPITHQEYYQLYAFFNSVDEPNFVLKNPDVPQSKIDALKKTIAGIKEKLKAGKKVASEARAFQEAKWKIIDFEEFVSKGGATLTKLEDMSILASQNNPSQDVYTFSAKISEPVRAIRIETLTHPSLPKTGPGRAGNGNFVLAELEVQSQNRLASLVAAAADHSQAGHAPALAFDGDLGSGWAINVSKGNMNVNRTAIFALSKPVTNDLQIKISTYNQGNGYNIGRLRISTSESVPEVVDSEVGRWETELAKVRGELSRLEKSQHATLVIRQRQEPRHSFIQLRGDFLDPGATVQPATFSVLHPLEQPSNFSPTRLDLANWLTSSDNPLTARVQANRMWQHLFGIGLVKTENDFGYQGSLPTHPKLLDYLAGDLMDNGWRLKRLYKKIAMSATYRQSSNFRKEMYEVDPANESLSKQNRYRVEGEIVRDMGLAASGLLSPKMGGPSVFPPIPPNVIGTSSAKHRWPTSRGEDRYRRGVYTAIYRANVYPMLLAFDGPDRDNACTRRGRSNTPLQALTMANDATFIEMSQAFGRQTMEQAETQKGRIEFAFQSAFARLPTGQEMNRIAEFQQSRLKFYESNPEETKAIAADDSAELASWINVTRVIMNLDEFITRE
ncbi:MAG: hypothetical protein ACI814_003389 [Mariniblastus sp.]|jgi:hypothetical protein